MTATIAASDSIGLPRWHVMVDLSAYHPGWKVETNEFGKLLTRDAVLARVSMSTGWGNTPHLLAIFFPLKNDGTEFATTATREIDPDGPEFSQLPEIVRQVWGRYVSGLPQADRRLADTRRWWSQHIAGNGEES